jgi:hypothetical protein
LFEAKTFLIEKLVLLVKIFKKYYTSDDSKILENNSLAEIDFPLGGGEMR